jgi:hypothetical protein
VAYVASAVLGLCISCDSFKCSGRWRVSRYLLCCIARPLWGSPVPSSFICIKRSDPRKALTWPVFSETVVEWVFSLSFYTYIIYNKYINTLSYAHTCIHACIHTYIYTFIHKYNRTCIHTYIRVSLTAGPDTATFNDLQCTWLSLATHTLHLAFLSKSHFCFLRRFESYAFRCIFACCMCCNLNNWNCWLAQVLRSPKHFGALTILWSIPVPIHPCECRPDTESSATRRGASGSSSWFGQLQRQLRMSGCFWGVTC